MVRAHVRLGLVPLVDGTRAAIPDNAAADRLAPLDCTVAPFVMCGAVNELVYVMKGEVLSNCPSEGEQAQDQLVGALSKVRFPPKLNVFSTLNNLNSTYPRLSERKMSPMPVAMRARRASHRAWFAFKIARPMSEDVVNSS
jgi:hypothetical protein